MDKKFYYRFPFLTLNPFKSVHVHDYTVLYHFSYDISGTMTVFYSQKEDEAESGCVPGSTMENKMASQIRLDLSEIIVFRLI